MFPLSAKICVLGYSGHGFVVVEALINLGFTSLYYTEKEKKEKAHYGLVYAGDEKQENFDWKQFDAFVLAVGDNQIRHGIVQRVERNNATLMSVIHPQAHVSQEAEIGKGTFIARGACVNPLVRLGTGTIINTGAVIDHECRIGDMAHIAPGAVLAGNVQVGKFAFVGANAVIKQGVQIGDSAIIGAGAVVLEDVPSNRVVVGNPAKFLDHG